jgi:hypothetical protein
MRIAVTLVLVIAVAILAGCYLGRNSIRPARKSLSLGGTTYGENLQRFGSPRQEGSVTKNDSIIKAMYRQWENHQPMA